MLLSAQEQAIKDKIERIGIPLKDWNIKVFRGILTGYNEAYIITKETRNKLVKQSPKSVEIIRPILLGKNIKKYFFEWEDLYIINAHNGLKSKGLLRINVEKDYPAVYNHLKQFQSDLEKRFDKGDSWTNLRNCTYLDSFEKPKIAWGNMALSCQFSYVPAGYFINAPSPFFTTDNLYLLAVLNSKVCDYYIKQLGVSRSGGYFEYKPMFVERMPIPKISEARQAPFIQLVQEIQKRKADSSACVRIQNEIDTMVFELFNLSDREIKQILKND